MGTLLSEHVARGSERFDIECLRQSQNPRGSNVSQLSVFQHIRKEKSILCQKRAVVVQIQCCILKILQGGKADVPKIRVAGIHAMCVCASCSEAVINLTSACSLGKVL